MSDQIVHKTWLLDGIFHSAPGFITIDQGKFSFSLVDTGTFSKQRLTKFESFSGLTDSFEKLRNEEVVEIVAADLTNVAADFPWYNFMGGAYFWFGDSDQRLHLSFMQPQNTKFPYHRVDNALVQLMAVNEGVNDMTAGRAFGKELQQLLGTPA